MRSTRLALCAAVLCAMLAPIARSTAAGAAGAQALSVYQGGGNVAGTNNFSSWLGRPVTYASDFVDHRHGWDAIARPNWLLDTWSSWVRAAPGRRLTLAVPMLPDSHWGQLRRGSEGWFDWYFTTLARNMVNRGLGWSVIRLGWEANHDNLPWAASVDPGAYKSYFRRIVNLMRSVPGAGFSFDWTANSGVSGGSYLTTFDSFYPGDAWVDIIGLDAYDIKWQDSWSSPRQRWDFTYNQRLGLREHREFALARGKPMSFPEWGLYRAWTQLGGGGDNPYYIDRMADWFGYNNVVYQTYFNVDWGGGTLFWFPNGQARYRARLGAG